MPLFWNTYALFNVLYRSEEALLAPPGLADCYCTATGTDDEISGYESDFSFIIILGVQPLKCVISMCYQASVERTRYPVGLRRLFVADRLLRGLHAVNPSSPYFQSIDIAEDHSQLAISALGR